jgi:hypothetical protein
MKHTCVALAMIASIPISASAWGWNYSESRLSYLNQNSTSDTKRRANLNLGTETGRNQYGLRYIQRTSENNPSLQEANITFGSHLADKLFVEGMVSAEKGDTYDNRGYGFRTEYETSFGRVGAFYRTWDDEETNTRVYSTFEAFPGLFSGIICYQSRIPTKTDASHDVVARYKTQTSGLYFATSREIDDDRSWQHAVSADYQFDKIHFLTGFGRRGHDNAATVFAFGFGGSYDMTERASLAVIVGQHRQSGAADIDISLTFNWSFGDAPNGERAIADTQTEAYRIAYIR